VALAAVLPVVVRSLPRWQVQAVALSATPKTVPLADEKSGADGLHCFPAFLTDITENVRVLGLKGKGDYLFLAPVQNHNVFAHSGLCCELFGLAQSLPSGLAGRVGFHIGVFFSALLFVLSVAFARETASRGGQWKGSPEGRHARPPGGKRSVAAMDGAKRRG
jgi:hypothetical protein